MRRLLRSRRLVAVSLTVAMAALSANASAAARPPERHGVAVTHHAAGTTVAAVPRFDHVVVLLMENHSAVNILGNPQAPYLNSLAASGASMTSSYAITHPSQPNYVALFSGALNGVTDDSCPHAIDADNLGADLTRAGLGFVTYSEDLPSVGYAGCTSGNYARKHNPAVDFPSVPASANQPLTAFPTDYSTLPALSFVVPNLQHDMHDGTIAQGDSWVQSNVKGYATWAAAHNSLLILTYDEDDYGSNNQIPTIFVGAGVGAGRYSEHITHYDVLRTLTDAFGLAPIGAGATASPILDIWTPPSGSPVPTFTSSCAALVCSTDAGASTGGLTAITSLAWNWGDGTPATTAGPTATHTYAVPGDYQVVLTVTNSGGQMGTTTRTVSPRAASDPGLFAADSFGRTTSGGFGAADLGGPWTISGTASRYGVAGGTGSMSMMTAGVTTGVSLPRTASSDTDLRVSLSTDKLATGNGTYIGLIGRQVSVDNNYQATVRIRGDGVPLLSLAALEGSATAVTLKSPITVPGLTVAGGGVLRTRFQVTGSSPTTLRLKVWAAAAVEPTAWQLSTTDSTPGLQSAGSVGITGYLSGGSTNAPVVLRLSEFSARATTAVSANTPPVALLTLSCANLVCSGDGTGSTDSTGTITGYAWHWGDGSPDGAGPTASHAYLTAGTYPVTLTMTDDAGATDTAVGSVSPTMAVNVVPVAALRVSCTNLVCSADSSGSSDPDGTVTALYWDWGDGSTPTAGVTATHTYAAAGSYLVALSVTDNRGGTGTASQTVNPTAADTAFAADRFSRLVTGGWGTADVGGAWSITGGAANFSVAGGAGAVTFTKVGVTYTGYLAGAVRTSTDFTTTVTTDKQANNSGMYYTFVGRHVGANLEYQSRARVTGTGSVVLSLGALNATSTAVTLAGQITVPGLTIPPGAAMNSRVQVTGTNPTTVRAKVWAATGTEPSGWQVSAVDSTAALQVPGSVGVNFYLSGSSTNVPIVLRLGPVTARALTP